MGNFYQSNYDGSIYYYITNSDGSQTGYAMNSDGSYETDANGNDVVVFDSTGYQSGVTNFTIPPDPSQPESLTFPPPAYSTGSTTSGTGTGTSSTTGSSNILSTFLDDLVGGISIPGVNSGTSVPGVAAASTNLTTTSTITLILIAGAAYFLLKGRS
jgi:hypothetical protein